MENYRLLVYPSKDCTKLIPYSSQTISGVNIPESFTFLGINVKLEEKYLVEIDEGNESVISVVKTFGASDWIFSEISSTNIFNRTVMKNDGGSRKINIPIPEDIIIDPLTWEFMVATIMLGGYPMFLGPTGAGKAQPLHSKILTPDGWKIMGEIKIGDEVITQSGKSTKVNGIFPQGEKEIFKVSFSDGAYTECCGEHLWNVKSFCDRNKRRGPKKNRIKIETKFSILRLDEIKDKLIYNGTHKNFSIPIVKPIEFKEKKQTLDPYFLGLLIGDGGMSQKTIHFSSEDEELLNSVDLFSKIFDCSFKIDIVSGKHIEGRITPIVRCGRKNNNKIILELRSLGLMGKKSEDKFVPDIYKYSSIEHRIKMLQGLMDTDGFTNGTNSSFCTSSKRLKDDVIEIVRSLGGTATYSTKIPKYKYLGKTLEGKESYNVSIKLCDINPFRLKRKADKYVSKTKYAPVRYITNVESVGMIEAQCISVEDESHLYVTDDYIVTHNTVLARALAKSLDYDFYYINCGGLFKPKQTLVGSVQAKDATTYVVESEFLTHFKSDRPTLILLDEISRIPGQAANMMMSITDREQAYVYIDELAQRVYKGKNVIFIATANFGIEYVDTRRLDVAFMDRFIPFVLRYLGESDETKLLNMKIPGLKPADIKNFVKIANILRANSETLGRSISHRRIIDMAKYLTMGFTYGEIVNNMLINLYVNGSDDRRDQVEQILSSKKINNAS